MVYQPAKLDSDALAGCDEFIGFRAGLCADQKEGGEPRRCILFSLVIRCRGGNQCTDQLAGIRDTLVIDPAALRITEQKSAISRNTVGIGGGGRVQTLSGVIIEAGGPAESLSPTL